MRKRAFIFGEYTLWWLIALGVLALGFITYAIFSDKLNAIGDFIAKLFRFGR